MIIVDAVRAFLGFLAGASLVLVVLVIGLYTSPPVQCSHRVHYVYVVDDQACLPVQAFVPAR